MPALQAREANAAVGMVMDERWRQLRLYPIQHDDTHDAGEIAQAAAAYALASAAETDLEREIAVDTWPWELDDFKPSTPLADLIRAGALLLAEIERRLRAGEEA
jgi:hypothetical protein